MERRRPAEFAKATATEEIHESLNRADLIGGDMVSKTAGARSIYAAYVMIFVTTRTFANLTFATLPPTPYKGGVELTVSHVRCRVATYYRSYDAIYESCLMESPKLHTNINISGVGYQTDNRP